MLDPEKAIFFTVSEGFGFANIVGMHEFIKTTYCSEYNVHVHVCLKILSNISHCKP